MSISYPASGPFGAWLDPQKWIARAPKTDPLGGGGKAKKSGLAHKKGASKLAPLPRGVCWALKEGLVVTSGHWRVLQYTIS